MKTLHIQGQRFGRLVATAPTGERQHRAVVWLALCDCGAQVRVQASRLVSGETRSCGCLRRDVAKLAGERARTHGLSRTSTYNIWWSMRDRCENPARKDYLRYGGAGVTVCERWGKFANFLADMGERPHGMTLDRIDGSKGYCKENCRWATVKEQNRNQAQNRLLEHGGEALCLAAWAERIGMSTVTLQARLRRGWSVQKALNAPVDKRFRNGKANVSPVHGEL